MPANDVNNVTLIGNLTADPELRQTANGKDVTEVRVASNSAYKKGEDWETKVGFFSVTVWGKPAVNAVKYLSKGDKVAVNGRLEYQEWEKSEGEGKNSRIVIVSNNLQYLKTKGKETADGDSEGATSSEDDIPF